MSIGFGIFLFVVGAILAFALDVEVDWIDLDLVGYLLMGAGVVVAVIGVILMVRKRQTVVTERTVDPVAGESVAQRTTSTDPEPPVR
jgi:hypothetical protein